MHLKLRTGVEDKAGAMSYLTFRKYRITVSYD